MRNAIVAVLAVPALAACGGSPEVEVVDSAEAAILQGCPPEVLVNWGARTVDTGTVTVTDDGTDLVVTITGAGGWLIDEWQVHAGTTPVQLNGGRNPSPGRFPYRGDPDPAQGSVVLRLPLASLGVACGEDLFLAVHSVMVRRDGAGKTVGQETAWAEWEEDFAGSRWGGSRTYTVCCDGGGGTGGSGGAGGSGGSGGSGGCVYPPWAFAQKPEIWPAGLESMYLGSSSYTATELRGFLARDDWWDLDDASLFLAVTTVGARLNLATGVVPPSEVGLALLAADAWFDANADADGRLLYGVSFVTAAGDQAKTVGAILEGFDKGQTGIPLCY